MARRIPENRLEQLIDCATRVFIEEGYRRTQMADVAEAIGVAKGTLYAHVESKEALFDLVARCTDNDTWRKAPPSFPVRTPKPGATLRYVRQRLARNQSIPALAEALGRKLVNNAAEELEAIVREFYDQLARSRCGIKLIDRSARDYPEFVFHGAMVFNPAPFYHIRHADLSLGMLVLCGFIGLWHIDEVCPVAVPVKRSHTLEWNALLVERDTDLTGVGTEDIVEEGQHPRGLPLFGDQGHCRAGRVGWPGDRQSSRCRA
jgi:AcrR family transcriptional regulator